MKLPDHRTRIVCTLGPATRDRQVLTDMIRGGMNVARLNFSHGDFESHGRAIDDVRAVSAELGIDVAILADLPGPKIRLGQVEGEPFDLAVGEPFTLTTEEIVGDRTRATVSFPPLPREAKPGDTIFVNDGFVQLEVIAVEGPEVRCVVRVGGEIRSRKGVNLPGIRLGASAFTEADRRGLEFALSRGVDAISQSFVERPEDLDSVRAAAKALGHEVFLIAKIERAAALERIDEILEASDGIMVARGDLGVEIPIERIALVQKDLILKANLLGKPVITATQMLESMTANPRPTRAEATDVANAILDGTDAVMLSAESAVGRYPVQAVRMLARIAATAETRPTGHEARATLRGAAPAGHTAPWDLLALAVATAVDRAAPAAVIVPTVTGATARSIARVRLPLWITAVSARVETLRRLLFTQGVATVLSPDHPGDWTGFAREWTASMGIEGDMALLTEGPSADHPDANHRMEILDLSARE